MFQSFELCEADEVRSVHFLKNNFSKELNCGGFMIFKRSDI